MTPIAQKARETHARFHYTRARDASFSDTREARDYAQDMADEAESEWTAAYAKAVPIYAAHTDPDDRWEAIYAALHTGDDLRTLDLVQEIVAVLDGEAQGEAA